MRTIFLDAVFAAAWQGQDPFKAATALALKGEVVRAVKNRRTVRFEQDRQTYYLKLHQPLRWREILRSLLRGSLPVLSAQNEWQALERLRRLGLNVPETAAAGQCGQYPAGICSFIITRALENSVDLESYTANWQQLPPPGPIRRALLKQVALVTRIMHDGGINHRDFYLCHLYLDQSCPATPKPRLYLMDLHRAQLRPHTPMRWIVKDIGGLYFSALHLGLSPIDLLRFVRTYSGLPLGQAMRKKKRLWQRVRRRAAALHREAVRKGRLPAGASRF